ncbi:MAG TPA: glycosyltransferase family 1 protein [Gemmatimonadaceae bacterium]|nr:glycosyltransferase family 1 protein [Gemmatimonadaceae bacterium]
MLRSIDEDQGIGIYTRNLLPRLLEADPETEYILIYRTPRFRGSFAGYPNATEVSLDMPTKLFWDQVGSPWTARRYGIDLLFNTKFTVPFLTGRRPVMMLHGSMQFVHPEYFGRVDIAYLRRVMPLYCRKAVHLIANSELTANDFADRLHVPQEKMTVIHLAADDHFRPVEDPEQRAAIRARYHLPQHFVLSVSKYFPGKNVPSLIRAYAALPPTLRSGLVLVGAGVDRYLDDLGLRDTPLAREIITPGWVDQHVLPTIYSMADVFAFPSSYEEFGIPMVEAMACGCPVVASSTGALPEVSDGAALLVDPFDLPGWTDALTRVMESAALRARLRQRGLARARHFSWREHAIRTAEVLHGCAVLRRPARAVA